MSRTTSVYLDLLRCAAALIVVFGHFTNEKFCTVFPDQQLYAVCAVSVFFVLSGFVISYVSQEKENRADIYAAARVGRLYSVLIPAIVFSLLVQLIVWKLDSSYLHLWTKDYFPAGLTHAQVIFRSIIKSIIPVTFLGEIHGLSGFPLLDGPMWSIGFEAGYYAMFGVFLFARRAYRPFLLVALALLLGMDILRLLPVWLAGVALHRLTSVGSNRIKDGAAGVFSIAIVAVQFLLWSRVRIWNFQPHGPLLDHLMHGHLYSSEAFLYYYWGTATWLSILAVATYEKWAALVLLPAEKVIRWAAMHTFSIYLFHFPVFVLMYAVAHYDRSSRVAGAIVFTLDIVVCILLSLLFEPTKRWWRNQSLKGIEYISSRSLETL